jgi:hypothetical protein
MPEEQKKGGGSKKSEKGDKTSKKSRDNTFNNSESVQIPVMLLENVEKYSKILNRLSEASEYKPLISLSIGELIATSEKNLKRVLTNEFDEDLVTQDDLTSLPEDSEDKKLYRDIEIRKERWIAVIDYLFNHDGKNVLDLFKSIVSKDKVVKETEREMLQTFELPCQEKLVIRLYENFNYYLRCELSGEKSLSINVEIYAKATSNE